MPDIRIPRESCAKVRTRAEVPTFSSQNGNPRILVPVESPECVREFDSSWSIDCVSDTRPIQSDYDDMGMLVAGSVDQDVLGVWGIVHERYG